MRTISDELSGAVRSRNVDKPKMHILPNGEEDTQSGQTEMSLGGAQTDCTETQVKNTLAFLLEAKKIIEAPPEKGNP